MHIASQPATSRPHGTNVASVMPLFSASTISDSAAFHRVIAGSEGIASDEIQFRVPSSTANPVSRSNRVLTVTKRTSPLGVDFHAPRTAWQHLTVPGRKTIDEGVAVRRLPWQRVVLHGSAAVSGSMGLLARYQKTVLGIADGTAYHFVIGNGTQTGNGEIEISPRWKQGLDLENAVLGDGSVHVCLVGDFHHNQPSAAQLQALDELLDYLSLKLGHLPVTTHEGMSKDGANCLGAKFPTEQVLKAAEE